VPKFACKDIQNTLPLLFIENELLRGVFPRTRQPDMPYQEQAGWVIS